MWNCMKDGGEWIGVELVYNGISVACAWSFAGFSKRHPRCRPSSDMMEMGSLVFFEN